MKRKRKRQLKEMIQSLVILSLVLFSFPGSSQINEDDPRLNSISKERNTDTNQKIKLKFERAVGLYFIFYDLSGQQIVLQFRDSRFEKKNLAKQFQAGRPYLVEFQTAVKKRSLPDKSTKSIQNLTSQNENSNQDNIIYGSFIQAQDLVLDKVRH